MLVPFVVCWSAVLQTLERIFFIGCEACRAPGPEVGSVRMRCAADHTFCAGAAALLPFWEWWGNCPICVIGSLCQAVGQLHGNGCVDVSFCADGAHIRNVMLPRVC